MRLESVKYSEFEGTPKHWTLAEFTLGQENLITGRNATGKTRTLNLIAGLGDLLSKDRGPKELNTGYYEAIFTHEESNYSLILDFQNQKVRSEKLIVDGKEILTRGSDGIGKLYYTELERPLDVQVAKTELACVTRADRKQTPWLCNLTRWGSNSRHFKFGDDLPQHNILAIGSSEPNVNLKETVRTVEICNLGIEEFGEDFINTVVSEMNSIGFPITTFAVTPLSVETKHIRYVTATPPVVVIFEKDVAAPYIHSHMSQGMFRSFSVLVQLTYSIKKQQANLIVIDDIGEGLDFERAQALIKVLREKSANSSIQLVMSTNNRFIMNDVPLKDWHILKRSGSVVRDFNYRNSKAIFDEFDFTGLSNFEFFASDFIENHGSQDLPAQ